MSLRPFAAVLALMLSTSCDDDDVAYSKRRVERHHTNQAEIARHRDERLADIERLEAREEEIERELDALGWGKGRFRPERETLRVPVLPAPGRWETRKTRRDRAEAERLLAEAGELVASNGKAAAWRETRDYVDQLEDTLLTVRKSHRDAGQ